MINFNTTKREDILIQQIVDRAKKADENITDYLSLQMDLTAVHCNDIKLDFNRLLNFDNFNFNHDVYGIMRNINRYNGKLKNNFLPRCSR